MHIQTLFYDQALMCTIMDDALADINAMRPVKSMAGPYEENKDTTALSQIPDAQEFLCTTPVPPILHQQYAVLTILYCSATLCEALREASPPSIINEWLDGKGSVYTLDDFCTRYETMLSGSANNGSCALPIDHVISEIMLLHLVSSTPVQ